MGELEWLGDLSDDVVWVSDPIVLFFRTMAGVTRLESKQNCSYQRLRVPGEYASLSVIKHTLMPSLHKKG